MPSKSKGRVWAPKQSHKKSAIPEQAAWVVEMTEREFDRRLQLMNTVRDRDAFKADPEESYSYYAHWGVEFRLAVKVYKLKRIVREWWSDWTTGLWDEWEGFWYRHQVRKQSALKRKVLRLLDQGKI